MLYENCLSYWYPKIQGVVPTPATEIFKFADGGQDLLMILDGKEPDCLKPLAEWITAAGDLLGWPCFLRTGHSSGKHEWDQTCLLKRPADIARHVANLAHWSECAGFLGLPSDVWVVRELLPTKPLLVAQNYHDMPVCREFRCFVEHGEIQCIHPYWPEKALLDGVRQKPDRFSIFEDEPQATVKPPGFDEIFRSLSELAEPDRRQVTELARAAGKAVGGHWSVDVLETTKGWFVTDMALAEQSWHWAECELGNKTSRKAVSNLSTVDNEGIHGVDPGSDCAREVEAIFKDAAPIS